MMDKLLIPVSLGSIDCVKNYLKTLNYLSIQEFIDRFNDANNFEEMATLEEISLTVLKGDPSKAIHGDKFKVALAAEYFNIDLFQYKQYIYTQEKIEKELQLKKLNLDIYPLFNREYYYINPSNIDHHKIATPFEYASENFLFKVVTKTRLFTFKDGADEFIRQKTNEYEFTHQLRDKIDVNWYDILLIRITNWYANLFKGKYGPIDATPYEKRIVPAHVNYDFIDDSKLDEMFLQRKADF